MKKPKIMEKGSIEQNRNQEEVQLQHQRLKQENQQISSSDESLMSEDQSDYKQKQVFYIPENVNENPSDSMEAQQAEAFQYLISVRRQAQDIRQHRKQLRKKYKMAKKQKISQQKAQIENKESEIKLQNPANRIQVAKKVFPNWFQAWRQQSLVSWNCIVQNFKFLHKNPENIDSLPKFSSKQHSAVESGSKLMNEKPLIGFLAKLTLSKIQHLLSELSELHYHSFSPNYYIWVYSLLAAHRAHAPYWSFQALADINACLMLSGKNMKNDTHNCEKLLVCCVMQKEFRQTYRNKIFQMLQNTQFIN